MIVIEAPTHNGLHVLRADNIAITGVINIGLDPHNLQSVSVVVVAPSLIQIKSKLTRYLSGLIFVGNGLSED